MAIGDVAKKAGMKEICFAELETLSVLRIWSQYTVHVYGKRGAGTLSLPLNFPGIRTLNQNTALKKLITGTTGHNRR
jgi:hypothetical protein